MERNSRKWFSALLVFIMIFSCFAFLTSCGSSSSDGDKVSSTVQSESDNASDSKDSKKVKNKKADTSDTTEKSGSEAGNDKDKSDSSDCKSEQKSSASASKKSKKSSSGTGSGTKKQSHKSSGSSKPKQQEVTKTATISVEGYCSGKTVTIEDGDTVYDVLKKSGASLKTESSVYGIYVVGINGLCEGDKGAGSGWTYTLNGEMVMKSANKVTVSDGSNVKWTFVTKGL